MAVLLCDDVACKFNVDGIDCTKTSVNLEYFDNYVKRVCRSKVLKRQKR